MENKIKSEPNKENEPNNNVPLQLALKLKTQRVEREC